MAFGKSSAVAWPGVLLAIAVAAGAAAQEGGSPLLPGAVAEALGAAAARAAPAVVRLHVERHAATHELKRQEERYRSRERRRLMRMDPQGGASQQTDWELFFQYGERPSGPTTGVIVGADGLVLTSQFNVDGPVRAVRVELADGRILPARVLGWDKNLDVAALRVETGGRPLPAIRLGRREEPLPGSFIVLVGASWGRVPYTANPGTVSALGRLDGSAIQLAVQANFSSTGGVVLDLEGRAVGIAGHVLPFGRTGLNSGVGFATGAARLLEVLERLEGGERIEDTAPPFVGIRLRDDPDKKRVFVEQVVPGSGAEDAGVNAGDLIVALAGTPVREAVDVRLALARTRTGQVVEMVVQRGGRIVRLSVRLGSRS
ncbi:MAG: trypsin-like peptidase domain-containing protein [Planctomycetes bacterium]|nr:trypsin-like peptidase domain-containing protein [Planctomycetota bacterium]